MARDNLLDILSLHPALKLVLLFLGGSFLIFGINGLLTQNQYAGSAALIFSVPLILIGLYGLVEVVVWLYSDIMKKTSKNQLFNDIITFVHNKRKEIEEYKKDLDNKVSVLSSLDTRELVFLCNRHGLATKYKQSADPITGKRGSKKVQYLTHQELVDQLVNHLSNEELENIIQNRSKLRNQYFEKTNQSYVINNVASNSFSSDPYQVNPAQTIINEIIDLIIKYKPYRDFAKEETYESALKERLAYKFGEQNVIPRYRLSNNSEIDIALPKYKIAIEVKNTPRANEIHRLIGQIYDYTKQGFFLVVVIFNAKGQKNQQRLSELIEFMQSHNIKACLIVDGQRYY